jgi:hypothetical protein
VPALPDGGRSLGTARHKKALSLAMTMLSTPCEGRLDGVSMSATSEFVERRRDPERVELEHHEAELEAIATRRATRIAVIECAGPVSSTGLRGRSSLLGTPGVCRSGPRTMRSWRRRSVRLDTHETRENSTRYYHATHDRCVAVWSDRDRFRKGTGCGPCVRVTDGNLTGRATGSRGNAISLGRRTAPPQRLAAFRAISQHNYAVFSRLANQR